MCSHDVGSASLWIFLTTYEFDSKVKTLLKQQENSLVPAAAEEKEVYKW